MGFYYFWDRIETLSEDFDEVNFNTGTFNGNRNLIKGHNIKVKSSGDELQRGLKRKQKQHDLYEICWLEAEQSESSEPSAAVLTYCKSFLFLLIFLNHSISTLYSISGVAKYEQKTYKWNESSSWENESPSPGSPAISHFPALQLSINYMFDFFWTLKYGFNLQQGVHRILKKKPSWNWNWKQIQGKLALLTLYCNPGGLTKPVSADRQSVKWVADERSGMKRENRSKCVFVLSVEILGADLFVFLFLFLESLTYFAEKHRYFCLCIWLPDLFLQGV